jgi:hypothetical protein
MSVDDLLKKRKGNFHRNPDFHQIRLRVLFCVRSNIYWNGERANPLFPYTPYLAKLKVNAAYYTSNARELVMSLDIPYYKGTRWRFKVDFKAQQNPTNLYFGLTESTLRPLRLPSTPIGPTYSTYSEYDRARKTLRSGEVGEAPL